MVSGLSGPALGRRERLIDWRQSTTPVSCLRELGRGRERGARWFPPDALEATGSGHPTWDWSFTGPGSGPGSVLMDADDRSSGPWHAPGPSAFSASRTTRALG